MAEVLPIVELLRYPIKSCAPQVMEEARLVSTGLEYDRAWMVVKAESGRFISQRTHPMMARIHGDVIGDELVVWSVIDSDGNVVPEDREDDSAFTRLEVRVPLGRSDDEGVRDVTVWKKPTAGVDEGDEVAALLSKVCREEVRLVRRPPSAEIPMDQFDLNVLKERTNTVEGGDAPLTDISYVDSHPLLVINEGSVQQLNEELSARGKGQVVVRCFRPNVVNSGATAYAEDEWRVVDVWRRAPEGEDSGPVRVARWYQSGYKGRCKLTTINPSTGQFAPKKLENGEPHPSYGEPLNTLRELRAPKVLGVEMPSPAPLFGANFNIASNSVGATIRRGDVLVVSRSGEPPEPLSA